MAGVSPEASLEISSSLHEMLQCMDQGTEESCRRFAELFTETAELHIPLVQVGADMRCAAVAAMLSLYRRLARKVLQSCKIFASFCMQSFPLALTGREILS